MHGMGCCGTIMRGAVWQPCNECLADLQRDPLRTLVHNLIVAAALQEARNLGYCDCARRG